MSAYTLMLRLNIVSSFCFRCLNSFLALTTLSPSSLATAWTLNSSSFTSLTLGKGTE